MKISSAFGCLELKSNTNSVFVRISFDIFICNTCSNIVNPVKSESHGIGGKKLLLAGFCHSRYNFIVFFPLELWYFSVSDRFCFFKFLLIYFFSKKRDLIMSICQ